MAAAADSMLKDNKEVYVEYTSQKDVALEQGVVNLTVDEDTEKRLQRKFDLRILPFGVLIWLLANIDRSNTGNAIILGMKEDADLTGNRFNMILTGFYLSYILLEIPTNIACRKLGPKKWLAFLTLGFGMTTFCVSFVSSYPVMMFLRVLLGCFESGIQPGIMYLYAQYYRRHELVGRWGVKASMASVAGSFGGLLASGLSNIPSAGILHSWRWIFFVEGLVSIALAVCVWIFLPNSVLEATFLSESDRDYAVRRIDSEMMATNKEPMDEMAFKRALLNWNTQLISLATLCSLMTLTALSLFMPTLLKSMGYSNIHAQLLTVPPFTCSAICCLASCFLSDRLKKRGVLFIYLVAFGITGFSILVGLRGTGIRYFAVFLATCGAFTAAPIFLAWAVDNAAGPSVRAVVSGYVVGAGNIGALIATWTYLPKSAPLYLQGHYINLGGTILMGFLVAVATRGLWRENRFRRAGGRAERLEQAPEMVARLGHLHPEYRYTL